MAPESIVQPDLKFIQIISPAVSPVYNNNAGYGILTFNQAPVTLEDFKTRFFNIPDYHMFGRKIYANFSLKSEVSDLNDVKKIRAFDTSLFYNF